MAHLRRTSDGKQESGARVESWSVKEDNTLGEVVGNEPMVGCCLLVGSVTARSYSDQDWWLTTPITEILERKEGYIKFRTKNSIYEFRE